MEQLAPELRIRDHLSFVAWVTAAHVVTYVAVGALVYFFVYRHQLEAFGFDVFMRNPNDPGEWRHVETWLIPAQVLRGLLFGAALSPFVRTFSAWRFRSRFSALLSLLLVFSVWSVTMPGPGSIEGWLYLKPDTEWRASTSLLGYIEIPTQLAAFSLVVSWRIGKLQSRRGSAEQRQAAEAAARLR